MSKQSKLTESEAISIHMLKPTATCPSSATTVAGAFGVNEKTVRDIWTGRTWSHATSPSSRGKKRPGRPRYQNLSIDDLLFVWEKQKASKASPATQSPTC